MRRNPDPSFVGLQRLKELHRDQILQFEEWVQRRTWERFHLSHFDWWTFPVDEPSGYGQAFVVLEGDVVELKSDDRFVADYRRGLHCVALSWGWDLSAGAFLSHPDPGQYWSHWPVRLYKTARSARMFGFREEGASLATLGRELLQMGESLVHQGTDLSAAITSCRE